MNLIDLKLGEAGRIVSVECEGAMRRRLFDLGFVPGTLVQPDLRSPAGDPTAYRVRGARVALRALDAGKIQIEQVKDRTEVA